MSNKQNSSASCDHQQPNQATLSRAHSTRRTAARTPASGGLEAGRAGAGVLRARVVTLRHVRERAGIVLVNLVQRRVREAQQLQDHINHAIIQSELLRGSRAIKKCDRLPKTPEPSLAHKPRADANCATSSQIKGTHRLVVLSEVAVEQAQHATPHRRAAGRAVNQTRAAGLTAYRSTGTCHPGRINARSSLSYPQAKSAMGSLT